MEREKSGISNVPSRKITTDRRATPQEVAYIMQHGLSTPAEVTAAIEQDIKARTRTAMEIAEMQDLLQGNLPASYRELQRAVEKTQGPLLDSCLGTVHMILEALDNSFTGETTEQIKEIMLEDNSFLSEMEVEEFVNSVQGETYGREDRVVQFVMNAAKRVFRQMPTVNSD